MGVICTLHRGLPAVRMENTVSYLKRQLHAWKKHCVLPENDHTMYYDLE